MPIDSWPMSAIAISHVTLHLGMGKSGGGNSLMNMGQDETRNDDDHDRGGIDQRIQKLRLWNHLCLTHIQFSIGNGRQSMVQQKFIDHCTGLLQLQSLRTNSHMDSYVDDCRLVAEVMLYWKTDQLLKDVQVQQPVSSGECKIAISLPALTTDCGDEKLVFTELAAWRAEWGYLLDEHDAASVRLHFSYLHCYLLLYRVSLRPTANTNTCESQHLLSAALRTSRAILSLFQSLELYSAPAPTPHPRTSSSSLQGATSILDLPDHYFFITIYAALTPCKFTIHDRLITSTQGCLLRIAPNDEHIASRFGMVLDVRKKAAAATSIIAYHDVSGTEHSVGKSNDISSDGVLAVSEEGASPVLAADTHPTDHTTISAIRGGEESVHTTMWDLEFVAAK
ncbi:hypothetical protein MPDQ_006113 [Monascus purpureus]|uniref:Transcription factor domain-containing protein n=1 Tax=Monascus purpureus TaxID=5098 RepID=A0A507R7M2_MONPU|nr:hypothetical protein MPDQ_006113 [Monascus purpureus]BDD62784.1 hypothetical protein MAP00_007745 [Monascus purpureus]